MFNLPKYKRLDRPIYTPPVSQGISPLHEIYPGRRYESNQQYDRYTIKPSKPELWKEAYNIRKQENQKAEELLQKLAQKKGGPDDDKITMYPAVDPSEAIENVAYGYYDSRVGPMQDVENANIPGPITSMSDESKENFTLSKENFTCPYKNNIKKSKSCHSCDFMKYIAILLLIILIIIIIIKYLHR